VLFCWKPHDTDVMNTKIDSTVEEAQNLIENGQTILKNLLKDPLLSDIPEDISIQEVQSMIDFENGNAMIIYIEKLDQTKLEIIVSRNSKVRDLKKKGQFDLKYLINNHNQQKFHGNMFG